MFKTIIILFFLLLPGLSQASPTMQCPSQLDWTAHHYWYSDVWGLKFELGDKALQNQWQEALVLGAPVDELPSTNSLQVVYFSGDSEDTGDDNNDPIGYIACNYTLKSGYEIRATKDIPFGTSIKLLGPFDKDRVCTTTAGNPGKCNWE